MLGMPASVVFFFDGQSRLDRTVVTFKEADFGLISGLLQGIHGAPATKQDLRRYGCSATHGADRSSL